LHLQKLRITLEALFTYVSEWKLQRQQEKGSNGGESSEVITVGELVLRMGRQTEGINLLEINSYLKASKVGIQAH
jgi:chromosome transmission fidelity protein 1